MKTKTNNAMGGGANASKKLMAAIAVLAVMFAAFAVVFVSDTTSADEAKPLTSDDGKISVPTNGTLDVTKKGNTFVFTGSAAMGTLVGNSNYNFTTSFGEEGKLYAAANFTMDVSKVGAKEIEVTQKNSVLSIYSGQSNIQNDNGTWMKISHADRSTDASYEFLIPKDTSVVEITLKTKDTSGKYTQIQGTYVFDFSKVSTKITLGETKLTGKNWSYDNSTLSLNNYDGREIFTASKNLT